MGATSEEQEKGNEMCFGKEQERIDSSHDYPRWRFCLLLGDLPQDHISDNGRSKKSSMGSSMISFN